VAIQYKTTWYNILIFQITKLRFFFRLFKKITENRRGAVGKKASVWLLRTLAGMGSNSIAFLSGGVSFVFSAYRQQSCLSQFFLNCLVLTARRYVQIAEV